jgi:hypothetical protein
VSRRTAQLAGCVNRDVLFFVDSDDQALGFGAVVTPL